MCGHEAVSRQEPKGNLFLCLISDDGKIVIPETSGRETMADAQSIFTAHLDSDFENCKIGGPSDKRPATPVRVFELVRNATWKNMFSSLSEDLGELALTGHQIREFCEKHKIWLHQGGHWTFFLLKEEDQFFVVRVRVYNSGGHLCANVDALENIGIWQAAGNCYRVVVPQL